MSATPVLLLTFNRPDLTREVLGAIRQARPEQLFVASDGPRSHVATDMARVEATRAVVDEMVDWPCAIERRYSDTNQGCRIGVSSAITWFFEHCDEGIILEDDCVPHTDFFGYCAELLERYRSDDRVMSIAGDNSVGLVLSNASESYCFTRQPLIWGWATWRRAWDRYDGDLAAWKTLRDDIQRQREIWPDPEVRRRRVRRLHELASLVEVDFWGPQWTFTLEANGGLSCTPAVNLVTNIGFGHGATHTTRGDDPRANVVTQSILPLTHPSGVVADRAVERQIFERVHGGATSRNPVRRGLLRLRRKLRRLSRIRCYSGPRRADN